jgi:predicted nucleotidyltransferase component of viral defense system
MFNRPHHQRIAKVLETFNCALLQEAECYFAGGTAIVLSLNEYRESVDIDFLCASNQGYRLLRNTVTSDLNTLLNTPVKHLREVRADRYGIRTVLEMDGIAIRVELVSEARITINGQVNPAFGVPTLSQEDMFAEKLLANADRGLDKSTMSRDIIDLAMMVAGWGDIPTPALAKVFGAYGEHAFTAVHKSLVLIQDAAYLKSCLEKMHMEQNLAEKIPNILATQIATLQQYNRSMAN